jgi:Uma2 family endonuclease
MNMMPSSDLQPFKLRIEDYELLDRAGAFDGRRTELIEGVIVAVNSEMLPHTRIKNELMFRLRLALRDRSDPYDAYVEGSLAFAPHNMPQPDVLVARIDAKGAYFNQHDVVLVIEVGATSLRGDLGIKRTLYADQGVPEYWVVDVDGRQVHQFWTPVDGSYADSRIVPLAGALQSATLSDLTIDGRGIL